MILNTFSHEISPVTHEHTYVFPSPPVPPLDFPECKFEYVLVPVSGTVSTPFDWDIQPGAAPENYNINWFRLNSDGLTISPIMEGISQENFSLTLQVNLSHNNTLYMCRVSIDHDGVGTGSPPIQYDGAKATLYTAGKVRRAYTSHVY